MNSPIDIINRKNQLTGRKSTPEDASNRGLWHRGAHVFIFTPTGRVLIQKRRPDVVQYSGLLDIGVAGFVDSGETPEQAAIREIKEEVGLDIPVESLLFLNLVRYNHRWKFRQKQKISRSIIYNYAVQLPHEHNNVIAQVDEVAWIGFLPTRSVLWLIRNGSLHRVGHLVPMYAYYRKAMKQALRALRAR